MHRIILTGGGTGGHVYPALAVAEVLKEDPDVEAILYIGALGHIEERLALERNLEFIGLSVGGMPRKLSLKFLSWPFQMLSAVMKARRLLQNFRPTSVLGTGGYASAPPLAAALSLKIPYAIHEPDAHPGLVNRLFAGNASLISLGMEGAAEQLKTRRGQVCVNGNPVSKNFANPISRSAASAVFGLRPECKTLLVTGGSQGAQALNEAVLQALPILLGGDLPIQVIHQVGDKNYNDFKQRLNPATLQCPRYHLRPYFDDLSKAYALCDLTVCRSGAMTISELAITGTPAIFVPFPYAAQDHQTFNGRFVESRGAARVLPQKDLTAESLMSVVAEILLDDAKLSSMRTAMKQLAKPNAAANLAEQLKQISGSNQAKS